MEPTSTPSLVRATSKRCLPITVAVTLLAAAASAQSNELGFAHNVEPSYTTRGPTGSGPGEMIARIDSGEYAGWANRGLGGTRDFEVTVYFQDQDASTVSAAYSIDVIEVYAYAEDPNNPGYPDVATRQYVDCLEHPPGPSGPVAYVMTTTVAASVPSQGNGDVFIGLAFYDAATWPLDGVSIHAVAGDPAGVPPGFRYDDPNHNQQPNDPSVAGTPANSHCLWTDHVVAPTYIPGLILKFDVVRQAAPGGAALAITNQFNYPSSNDPPPAPWTLPAGTATFLSGISPQVALRGDRVGFRYYRSGSGSPLVFFLYDIGQFGLEYPLSNLLPNGEGDVCVKPTAIVAGLGTTDPSAPDVAWRIQGFPGVGTWIHGLPFIQQAIEWDPVNLAGYASPCSRQRF